ncbi:hypothetical protein GCM10007919_03250 [Rhizobium indigoferae]|nr:hypothetical protein GCM10007919_03250 [Rhizobium indigoferae]
MTVSRGIGSAERHRDGREFVGMRPDFPLNVLAELQMPTWQPADLERVIGRKAGTMVPYAVGARAAITAPNPAVSL